MQEQAIPYGYCECGCGQKTRLAPITSTNDGWVKGKPLRFMRGHARKGKRNTPEHNAKVAAANSRERGGQWKGEQAGYRAIHAHLCKYFPKTHVCDECGQYANRTEYALIHGREYTRERENYREMCRPCHMHYDLTSDTCKRGHPWTPESTVYHSKTGKRSCRICRNANRRKWDAARRRSRNDLTPPSPPRSTEKS